MHWAYEDSKHILMLVGTRPESPLLLNGIHSIWIWKCGLSDAHMADGGRCSETTGGM